MIRLNVGGVKREVLFKTLSKSPVFETIFNSDTFNETKELFLDRDVELFDDVIMHLAYGTVPDTIESVYELLYFGVKLQLNAIESNSEFAEDTIEQILDDTQYFISACGTLFVVSVYNIKKLPYFEIILNGNFAKKYKGTVDDPYQIEIPPLIMKNIISNLRNHKVTLIPKAKVILESLSSTLTSLTSTTSTSSPTSDQSKNISNQDLFHSGLFQLVARDGPIDNTVTFDPQFTFWKRNVKRYSKFSHIRITMPFENDFKENEKKISFYRNGDLIYKCYLEWKFKIDGKFIKEDDLLLQNPYLPYQLINSIYLEGNNGSCIESLNGYQIFMLEKMKGLNHNTTSWCIDIPFHFSLNTYHAIPICLLSATSLYIKLQINNTLIEHINEVTGTANVPIEIVPQMIFTYVLLNEEEKRQYRKIDSICKHVSLFKTPVCIEIKKPGEWNEIRLNYVEPTSAIFFTLHEDNLYKNKFYPMQRDIEYVLKLNKYPRIVGNKTTSYLDKKDHYVDVNSNVYVLPFALDVLDRSNPCGYYNLRDIDDVTLEIKAPCDVKYICMWTNYWNITKISSGTIFLIYAS